MARKEAGAPLDRGATPWIVVATLVGQMVVIPAVRADQAEGASPVSAATESGALDEIVVTAQRRSENIQAIGLSIAALSAEDVDSMNVSGAKEMVNHVSGVLVND